MKKSYFFFYLAGAAGLTVLIFTLLPFLSAIIFWILGFLAYIASILTYESLNRRKYQNKMALTINQFVKTNEMISEKLSTLSSKLESFPAQGVSNGMLSADILTEIKILQTLMDKTKLTPEPGERAFHEGIETPSQEEKPHEDKKIDIRDYDRSEILGFLQEAIKHDRIEMLLQPIVSLPQKKPRFFECYSRVRTQDGTILLPSHYLDIATEESLIRYIDNTLLFRSIQVIRHGLRKKIHVPVFCNLSIATLQDTFFVESFVDFIRSHPELAHYIIFEMNAGRFLANREAIQKHLGELHDFGCFFSLDGIQDIDLDLFTLGKQHIRFIKLDTPFLLKFTHLESEFQRLLALKEQADEANINLILSKVETDQELLNLSDLHLDFAQGYLFGEPKLNTRI